MIRRMIAELNVFPSKLKYKHTAVIQLSIVKSFKELYRKRKKGGDRRSEST